MVGLVGLVTALGGCVGHSRTTDDYRNKAVSTADQVRSSVETVRLAVQGALDDRAFGAYLSEVISQAEEDATAAVDALMVVQPPNHRSDAVRQEADDVTSAAVQLLSQARIAIRRGDTETLRELVEPLEQASADLAAFSEEQHTREAREALGREPSEETPPGGTTASAEPGDPGEPGERHAARGLVEPVEPVEPGVPDAAPRSVGVGRR